MKEGGREGVSEGGREGEIRLLTHTQRYMYMCTNANIP